MATPPAAPLSAAAAALLATEALDHKKHVIVDAVVHHVRAKTPVTGYNEFWHAVAKTVHETSGINETHNAIKSEYNGYRKWAKGQYGNDSDERKHVKNMLRTAERVGKRAAAAKKKKVEEEEEERNEREEMEEEDDEEEGESAFTGFQEELGLAVPDASAQAPPAAPAGTFSLAFRPKEG